MDLVIASGSALRHFTRAIACLTKWGEEIHVAAAPRQLKLSSINASRTAFAAVTFPAHFFPSYHVRAPAGEAIVSFSVVGKALLSPLRPRSANTIETCSISVTGQDLTQHRRHNGSYGDDDDDATSERGSATAAAPQCRIVIRLHCQHGVTKTHRMTYSSGSTALYPQAKRDACTITWIASSRILKEWTDHFHLRSGSQGGGSDEISFDLHENSCRLRSFGVDTSSDNPGQSRASSLETIRQESLTLVRKRRFVPSFFSADSLSSRPLSTELVISVSDFDLYEVLRPSVITFGLKEFKSIIALADAVPATVDVACSRGGEPVLILVEAENCRADFVIATTDFDGDDQDDAARDRDNMVRGRRGKAEEEPLRVHAERGKKAQDRAVEQERPLFNRATPTQEPPSPPAPPPPMRALHGDQDADEGEDEFDYGAAMDDFGDDAFAQIDQLTQEALSQRPPPMQTPSASHFGPTQGIDHRMSKKSKRWNLLGGDGDSSPSP
ncbi:BZ3500_MvSof-1268-A1-R1_Chr3-1g05581 [Microbotryum saponariae]|uniref:BZ3500_MvSof-1268-A1-R1_Chr3-1g05581 protein n=1 Tax=Microbotryum saponariae TaxID=289078 RepID=A0A2X0LD43_9BASI|nr:BZ3500_MvSof-1268-A1-R1_Chr3-1g05581 [Microbotryum saponariae]SDA04771.1 BZ3501_MvSof-1269-A2-R1_Chr3-1g05251 [Microbotryum saponariae]